MPSLRVELGPESYDVIVERGRLRELGSLVRAVAPHARVMLVMDANVVSPHGDVARTSLEAAGFAVATIALEAKETAKTLATAHRLYDAMLAARLERGSPVVALGGGLVGDVAGFAAATFLRGVPLVQVPTTLLAMVDASIGGKTGVNHAPPGAAEPVKNLVGAFWQPRAVLADPEVLRTLDARHLRCGLAECVKHGLVADAGLLDRLERDGASIAAAEPGPLADVIARSAAVKISIVTRDVREAGCRALLNLGHTFGHALEPIAELGLHHGEAVAIGLVAAMHCARRTGRAGPGDLERVRRLLSVLGLPAQMPRPVRVDRLMTLMRYDKKRRDGRLRLVLPRGIGAAEVTDDVPGEIVESAWREVGAE